GTGPAVCRCRGARHRLAWFRRESLGDKSGRRLGARVGARGRLAPRTRASTLAAIEGPAHRLRVRALGRRPSVGARGQPVDARLLLELLWLALLVHFVLTFPDGRARSNPARVVIAGTYA